MRVHAIPLRYVGKRFLLLLPALVLVSLIAFALQESAPGDPVAIYLRDQPDELPSGEGERKLREAAFRRAVKELAADWPVFYFSLRPLSQPDTLHRVLPTAVREAYSSWCRYTGEARPVANWYARLETARIEVSRIAGNDDRDPAHRLLSVIASLQREPPGSGVRKWLDQWPENLYPDIRRTLTSALPAAAKGFAWRNYVPVLRFHGIENRYHRWICSLFTPAAQKSWQDGQPVWRKIRQAARWTLLMNGIAILLAYGLSIPLGVWLAGKAGTRADGWLSLVLFALYAVPTFWLGTLLLVFFTSPTYGMPFFPSIGLGDIPPGAGWAEVIGIRTAHMILPVFCLTYGSLAYLTRQVRSAMLRELKQDYIRTAWSAGQSARQVLWRQAFPNALLPLITLLAHVLPAALAGSVAIEVIFNIPGMGRLGYQAISAQDWPVVYGVLFLAALLTLAGSLLADLFYGLADPRIRLGK
ncbi:MAG: ABC transporter permease [Saprospiraceae bacterium]|nr:ABC transporter permease [Saprospiraceae bacterium]